MEAVSSFHFGGLFEKNIFLMFHFFHEKNVHLHVFKFATFLGSVSFLVIVRVSLLGTYVTTFPKHVAPTFCFHAKSKAI